MLQYFSRANKSLVLRHGPPSYEDFDSLVAPEETARCALYSPDGSKFAYSAGEVTKVLHPDTRAVIAEIPVQAADMYFSPLGSYLVTWNRPKRDPATNTYLNNLKLWNAETGSLEAEFKQTIQGSFKGGWNVQFTADEKFCVQKTGPKTLTVTDSELKSETKRSKFGTLNLPVNIEDFVVSPGKNPCVSVFNGTNNGKPGCVRVYKLPSLSQPVAQHTLFNASSVQMNWNSSGTAVLVIAQSDVDTSNKSYYGESSLHLLNVTTGADKRIDLDREGPVYDTAWSPDGQEFGATYGLMPAKTSFFDNRGTEQFTMPLAPRNQLRYSPHGNFVVIAGFGNLQGNMDIYDRTRNFLKVGAFLAQNSTWYEWSPCSKYLLTATTSPRLRVDNGVKIWDFKGNLLFSHDENELYSVGWRPTKTPLNLNDYKPVIHKSAESATIVRPSEKPKAAYVPPHARGKQGQAPRTVKSLYEASNKQNTNKQNTGPGNYKPSGPGGANGSNGASSGPQLVGTESVEQSPEKKKIRSLVKKLRAIDELKNREMAGETLEVTQIKKIGTEGKVRSKLKELGWTEGQEL